MNGPRATALAPRSAPGRLRTACYRVGAFIINSARLVALTSGVLAAATTHALRPRTWRRSVRRELVRHCWQAGVAALVPTLMASVLAGFFLVFQILFWLDEFDDLIKVATLVIGNLVREIAPLTVALIVIGRSTTVSIVELASMQANGQVRMLDSQGIDSFDFLVVTRVVALAACTWALSMTFVLATLSAGYLFGRLGGIAEFPIGEFLAAVAGILTPRDYALFPLKSLLVGALVGCVAAVTVFGSTTSRPDMQRLLSLGFTRALLVTLLASGALSVLVIA